jgi:hypothetical protein
MLSAAVLAVLLASLAQDSVGGTLPASVSVLFPTTGSIGTLINIQGEGFGVQKRARVWIDPVDGARPRHARGFVSLILTLSG